MFDEEFFPTPPEVGKLMFKGLESEINNFNSILEPSAGKGDLLDQWKIFAESRYKTRGEIKFFCIEKNRDLQAILKAKKYQVVDNDFLKYSPEDSFDLIIMNPPFSNGVKHFLKAYQISNGAEIRCLLNSESVRNPCTKERQLMLRLIQECEGTVEHLGSCFKDSENKTNVEVCLITIPLDKKESSFNFDTSSLGEKDYKFEDVLNNQVSKINVFQNQVDKYEKVKSLYAEMMNCKKQIQHYSKDLTSRDIESILNDAHSENLDHSYYKFVKSLRKSSWDYIFSKTKIANFITNKVQTEFYKKQSEQEICAFTVDNIENLLLNLMCNQGNMMQDCLVEAFDLMTKYYDENRSYIEGWKTNKRWKVNKKIILPGAISWIDLKYPTNTPRIDRDMQRKLSDIEKALCFISGESYAGIDNFISDCCENIYYGDWNESKFFRFKLFKKGTIHLEFLSDFIHKEFNIKAVAGKQWLGDGDE